MLRAPSGFGKSVAAASWVADPAGPDEAAIWMRADPSFDAAGFWRQLAELLDEAGLIDRARLPTADGGNGALHRAVETILRRGGAPLTLVVDDFDALADRAVEQQLTELVRFCPHLHLIVCLRSSRSFPTTIRATVPTTVIESPDLAFTPAEVAELIPGDLRHRHADWHVDLHRCTGGWPEPTRAVLLALQDNPAQTVDDAAILVAREFLAERVLTPLGDHAWTEFALHTAIPERLTGRAAAKVSGDEAATRRLRRLERAGVLSVTVQQGRRVYRWPDAARRALAEEAQRRDPQRVRRQHREMASWYLAEGDVRSAAVHAIRAGDHRLVVSLVEQHWGRLLHEDLAVLDAALAAIPLNEIRRSPRVAAARDVRMRVLGDLTDSFVLTMPDPLPRGEAELAAVARSDRADDALRTGSSLMVAMRMRGMAERALDYARRTATLGRVAAAHRPAEVWRSLPVTLLGIGVTRLIFDDPAGAESALLRAYQASENFTTGYVRRDAAGKLALLKALQGHTAQAQAWHRRYRAAPATPGTLSPRIDRSALLADALICIDRLDRNGLSEVLPLLDASFSEEENWIPFTAYVRARGALLWGDREGERQALSDERARMGPWLLDGSTMGPLVTAALVDLLLSLGLGGLARSHLDAATPHRALQPVAARVSLLSGDTDAALRLACGYEPAHSPSARAELLLAGAVARHRRREEAAAADLLRRALRIVRATGALFPFVTVPRDELCEIADGVPGAGQLLESPPLRDVPSPLAGRVAVIALTGRERTVLGQLADGRTLQEIARDLFVSYNTVKTQVRSLYAKLGASSRPSALISAAQHGLLSPRNQP